MVARYRAGTFATMLLIARLRASVTRPSKLLPSDGETNDHLTAAGERGLTVDQAPPDKTVAHACCGRGMHPELVGEGAHLLGSLRRQGYQRAELRKSDSVVDLGDRARRNGDERPRRPQDAIHDAIELVANTSRTGHLLHAIIVRLHGFSTGTPRARNDCRSDQ